jgi:hypothetical protein
MKVSVSKCLLSVMIFGLVSFLYSSRLISVPDTISVTLLQNQTKEIKLTIKIDEAMAETDYTGYIDYIDEFLKPIIDSLSFDDSLELNTTGHLFWSLETDSVETLNGSQYACVKAKTEGPSMTSYGYLTTKIFDFSMIPEPAIEFEHVKTGSLSQVSVQVSSDGSSWVEIYTATGIIGSWSVPEVKKINIPREFAKPCTSFRFVAAMPKNSGTWAIDNLKVKGNKWLSLNDSLTASGTVKNWMYEIIDDTVRVNIGNAALSSGLYQALIRFESVLNNFHVPVDLTVIEQLSVPEVLINSVTDQVVLSWSEVNGATSYKIYSSDDPYGTFIEVSGDGIFSGTSWSAPVGTDQKKFYYVVGVSE